MTPTPTNQILPFRDRGFASLTDALEYAADGESGYNFYDSRGRLEHVLTYRRLRDEARVLAGRLAGLGLERGARVGILAATTPDFHRFFFACQYAGLLPVALPTEFQMGARDAFIGQLHRMLHSCQASLAVAPSAYADLLRQAAHGLDLVKVGSPADFDALECVTDRFDTPRPHELAYLQYTSGSTRFPRGVEITHRAVLTNIAEISEHALGFTPKDRLASWLPLYHDMGLVGFVLAPVATQLSVDYLETRTFAMRPRLWLKLISDNGCTMSSSPPFGYALCARRLRASDSEQLDLSSWRVACVGAERIHPEPLQHFADMLAPSGFDPRAFVACYGMAECSLATSFAPLNNGVEIDRVDREQMTDDQRAVPVAEDSEQAIELVDCGSPLPSYEVSIRDAHDNELAERECGRICIRGPSVMSGYFRDPDATGAVLDEDGWLDTGDIGYRIGTRLVVTARRKDVIIVNGRNIWPQDLEYVGERLLDIRTGGVCAFSVSRPSGEELVVLVVQTRETSSAKREELVERLRNAVRDEFGIDCHIDLVPPRTLPRTSSGKLSRSRTRQDFLKRIVWSDEGWPQPLADGEVRERAG